MLCHGVAVASPRRLAQAPDAAGKVTQLNREALAAIDKREFEKAREILKRALELCETSGLGQHAVAARTHVHMGVVIIEGFKNRELGEKQFGAALAIEPGIAMTPTWRNCSHVIAASGVAADRRPKTPRFQTASPAANRPGTLSGREACADSFGFFTFARAVGRTP